MAKPIILSPYIVIQNDWNEVLRKDNGEAWVTCKINERPGIEGTLKGKSSRGNPPGLSASARFHVEAVDDRAIEVSHSNPNCRCTFVAPVATFSSVHLRSIVALDVTSGGLGVSACVQNKLHIWETEKGVIRRTLAGHVGDVYTCRFFPSGLVVLSAGADMQLKVWSAKSGQCAATMRGHVGAILDTAIVERGRNVISVSRDGTAKLWDCGTSSCVATLADVGCDINGCALTELMAMETSNVNRCDREVGTEGKVLLLACEDKTLRGVDARGRNEIFVQSCSTAVSVCCFSSPSEIVCGCQNGTLYLFDVRNMSRAVLSWLDSAAAVLTLQKYKNGIWAGKYGLCIYYDVRGDERMQLCGSDCDPVYSIVFDGKHIFTCSRDAVIRKYLPL